MPDFPPQPLQGCFSRHGIAGNWFACTEKSLFSGFLGKILDSKLLLVLYLSIISKIFWNRSLACEASGAVVFMRFFQGILGSFLALLWLPYHSFFRQFQKFDASSQGKPSPQGRHFLLSSHRPLFTLKVM